MEKVLSEAGTERYRQIYLRGGRREKSRILDEFCELTKCHRKHAVRVFSKRQAGRPANPEKRGRKSRYDRPEFIRALKKVYNEMDRMCSKLLKAALPEWLPSIEERSGNFPSDVRLDLLRISPATMDRVLHDWKKDQPKKRGGTKPGTIKREEIPIRRGVWEESRPGYLESDTVSHGGYEASGQFVWSLTMTDIATHWTECRAIWHKGARFVVEAVKEIEAALPFNLLGFDCDNGGEFMNRYLIQYFTAEHPRKGLIEFTRSRENKKNDNAHVEQRNWSHARQLFARERLDFLELVELMNDIYSNEFSLLRNHFYPTMKLDSRVLILSRYRRRYGDPLTPYERVLRSPDISEETKQRLQEFHKTLNPLQLKESLDRKLNSFWRLVRKLKSTRDTSQLEVA
jgi:hypothetical protein